MEDSFEPDINPDTILSLETAQLIARSSPEEAEKLRNAFSVSLNPTNSTKDSWNPFTLKDAYKERPPIDYVVRPLFALPSLSIVYGAPGTYKSFLIADLLICIAKGEEWLPSAPWIQNNSVHGHPTNQANVMWIDFDNGRRRTHDRFGALGRGHNLTDNAPLVYYSMPSPWLDAGNQEHMQQLENRIREHEAKFIVIDNLGVVTGNADENSGEMIQVMSQFRQLAENTDSAVVLIHHQRKSNGTNSRAGDNLRGHSGIEASLDLGLHIKRDNFSEQVICTPTKVRGADIFPFSAAFTFENRSDGELHSAQFFSIPSKESNKEIVIEKEIIRCVKEEGPLNKSELTRKVKIILEEVGVNRIRNKVEELSQSGEINEKSGDRPGEKVFYVNDE